MDCLLICYYCYSLLLLLFPTIFFLTYLCTIFITRLHSLAQDGVERFFRIASVPQTSQGKNNNPFQALDGKLFLARALQKNRRINPPVANALQVRSWLTDEHRKRDAGEVLSLHDVSSDLLHHVPNYSSELVQKLLVRVLVSSLWRCRLHSVELPFHLVFRLSHGFSDEIERERERKREKIRIKNRNKWIIDLFLIFDFLF